MLLVLDTPVVLKWFAEEEGSEIALDIKEGLVEGDYDVMVRGQDLYFSVSQCEV